jgi:hypothetical protein
MLKECEKEKTRGVLHPKCGIERRKVNCLLFLHFFFLWLFFSLCVFFFLMLEKKKMPRRKCLKQKGRNKRPEVRTKSERAKLKLESELFPFSEFFSFL